MTQHFPADEQKDRDAEETKRKEKFEETEHEFEDNSMGLVSEKQQRRRSRMSFQQRVDRYIEATQDNGYFNPDLCPKVMVPPEVQIAMEDELGPDFIRQHGLVLLFHFWFKRWCICQEATDGKGQRGYRIVYLCCGDKKAGYIPPDLDDDAHFDILVGAIGDFKLPDRRDFQCVNEMINPRVYETDKARTAKLIEIQKKKEEQARKDFDTWMEGYMDHYSLAIRREFSEKWGDYSRFHMPVTSLDALRAERDNKFNFQKGEGQYSLVKYKNWPEPDKDLLDEPFPIDRAIMAFWARQAYGREERNPDAIEQFNKLLEAIKAKRDELNRDDRSVWHNMLVAAQNNISEAEHKGDKKQLVEAMDNFAGIILLEPGITQQEAEIRIRRLEDSYERVAAR